MVIEYKKVKETSGFPFEMIRKLVGNLDVEPC